MKLTETIANDCDDCHDIQMTRCRFLLGEVKGLRPPGRHMSSFHDVALRDGQNCRIGRPYTDAQDRLLWRDKNCPART